MPVHFSNRVGSLLKHYKSWSKPNSYEVSHNITKFDLKQKKYFKNKQIYILEGKNYNPIVELRQYNYTVIWFFFVVFLHTKHILVAS